VALTRGGALSPHFFFFSSCLLYLLISVLFFFLLFFFPLEHWPLSLFFLRVSPVTCIQILSFPRCWIRIFPPLSGLNGLLDEWGEYPTTCQST